MIDHCPFCALQSDQVLLENNLVIGLWDKFPLSPGHALLIPKRHVVDWFEATTEEQQELTSALSEAKQAIEVLTRANIYHIGMNLGQAAGQTIFHLHIHLIPRYENDQSDPRGGIRKLFPDKARYWETNKI